MNHYPFTSRYFELPEGKIHYIDEGQGEVIVFSHGTPEWSFAYRHFIRALLPHYRCIALDHFGFGLSDKPADGDYTIQRQAARFEAFLRHLNLDHLTLVANDFGVSIALSYALNYPEHIRRICISNGWMWSLKSDPHFARPGKLLQGWIGKLLYIHLNFSVSVMMSNGYGDKNKLSKEILQYYQKPFSKKKDRKATLVYAREILNASDWWQYQWNRIDRLQYIPIQLCWGMQDKFLRISELQNWKARLSNLHVTELPCGHFPHEEEPEQMISVLKEFLKIKPAQA